MTLAKDGASAAETSSAAPARAIERFTAWARRVNLERKLTVVLLVAAVTAGLATFAAMTERLPTQADATLILLLAQPRPGAAALPGRADRPAPGHPAHRQQARRGRRAAACPAGRLLQPGGRDADDHRRDLRGALLRLRSARLVQPAGQHRGQGVAGGGPGLSGGASPHDQRRRPGHGPGPEPPGQPAGLQPAALQPDRRRPVGRALPDRGGGLRRLGARAGARRLQPACSTSIRRFRTGPCSAPRVARW